MLIKSASKVGEGIRSDVGNALSGLREKVHTVALNSRASSKYNDPDYVPPATNTDLQDDGEYDRTRVKYDDYAWNRYNRIHWAHIPLHR